MLIISFPLDILDGLTVIGMGRCQDLSDFHKDQIIADCVKASQHQQGLWGAPGKQWNY